MIKKYALYCSGGASRVLNFFDDNDLINFPLEFIFYDGKRPDVTSKLFNKFRDKLIEFNTNINPSNELLNYMLKHNIDYLFCFGDRILKGKILELYKNKIVNFHPSLLPAFPGVNAIDKALKTSVQLLGNTAHFIDEGVDTGPIIMQSVISRKSYSCYEDVLSLQIKMLEKIWKLLDTDQIKVVNCLVEINQTVKNKTFYSI